MSDKVWIFDTTLRDGEQALKASLTEDDKLQLSHTISRLNVDVMARIFLILDAFIHSA